MIHGRVGMFAVARRIGRVFALQWWRLLIIAPLLLLPAFGYLYSPLPTFEEWRGFFNYGPEIGSVLDSVVPLLLTSPFWAAVLYATLLSYTGRPMNIWEALRQGVRLSIPIFVIFVLILVCTFVGLAFLIIPGFMALIFLSLAPAIYIAEGRDIIGSLQRSWFFTRGYRLKLFFFFALQYALVKLAGSIIDPTGALVFTATVTFEPILIGVLYLQIFEAKGEIGGMQMDAKEPKASME